MTAEDGKKPTITDLKQMIEHPSPPTGRFNLRPGITAAIPVPKPPVSTEEVLDHELNEAFGDSPRNLPEITARDMEEALKDEASKAFDEELIIQVVNMGHNELLERRSRLRFIRGSLGYGDRRLAKRMGITLKNAEEGDKRLAQYLGITANQIKREDMRGRRKEEVDRFEQKFKGLFTLSSILTRFVDNIIDRRVALVRPNSRLSDVSISNVIKEGFPNIAVSIALDAIRQREETMGYQK